MSPLRPLCHVRAPRQRHPRVGPPRWPVSQLLRHNPRSRSYMHTGRTTMPQRERIRQDSRQLHRTVRHTVTRIEIVLRACKLLPLGL
jgi:hypothetical protein